MDISRPMTFTAVSDEPSGHRLAAIFHGLWPVYEEWLVNSPRQNPLPSAEQSVAQLHKHMPELLPNFGRLLRIFGAPKHLPQFLCMYNPPTFVAGCSQAVWKRDNEIALIRNYDFPQHRWDGLQLRTKWNDTDVVAMTDCVWGVLDGINQHGLAVSLSFGGKMKVGNGFSITLVLRYILEFCSTTREAEKVLNRVPVAMAYNVVLVDKLRSHRIVYVGPDQEAKFTEHLCTTNHQLRIDPESSLEILDDSNVRLQFLNTRLADNKETLNHMLGLFQQQPLYRRAEEANGWGTLYTSSYFPKSGAMSLIWPDKSLEQSFEQFHECQLDIGGSSESVNFV